MPTFFFSLVTERCFVEDDAVDDLLFELFRRDISTAIRCGIPHFCCAAEADDAFSAATKTTQALVEHGFVIKEVWFDIADLLSPAQGTPVT